MSNFFNNPLYEDLKAAQTEDSIFRKSSPVLESLVESQKQNLGQVASQQRQALQDLTSRARRQQNLLDVFDPEVEVDPLAIIGGGGFNSEVVRRVNAGLASGIADTIDAATDIAGDIGSAALDALRPEIENEPTLLDTARTQAAAVIDAVRDLVPNVPEALSGGLRAISEELESQIDPWATEDARMSTPSGDLDKPSTWSMGQRPTLSGLARVSLDTIAQSAPSLIGAIANPAAGAAIGGLQGYGEHAGEARDMIESQSFDQLYEGNQLYKDFIEAGESPESAKQKTADIAARVAGLSGGAVAGLGGFALGAIISPVGRVASALPTGAAGRGAGVLAASAIEGGLTEVAEDIVAATGYNYVTGENVDVWEDTFASAILGAIADSTTATPVAVGRAIKYQADKYAEENARLYEESRSAILSGDVSSLLDTQSKNYNPVGIASFAQAEVLKEGNTPEQVEAAKQSVKMVAEHLQTRINNIDQQLTHFSPEGQQANVEALAEINNVIQGLSEENPKLEGLRKKAKALSTLVGLAQNSETMIEALNEDRNKLSKALDAVQQVDDINHNSVVPTADEVTQQVSLAESTTVPANERSDAAAQVFSMAIRSPESITTEQAVKLSEDQTNGLNPAQRLYLRKLSEAKQAMVRRAKIEDVRQGVVEGTDGFRGVQEYQRDIAYAVRNNNSENAQSLLDTLNNFNINMSSKSAAVNEAYQAAQDSGTNQQLMVVRGESPGSWQVLPAGTQLSRQQLASVGGLAIHRGSGKLVRAISEDAIIVSSTLDAANIAVEQMGTQSEATPAAPVETPVEAVQEPVAEVQETTEPVQQEQVQEEEQAQAEVEVEETPTLVQEEVAEFKKVDVLNNENYREINLVDHRFTKSRSAISTEVMNNPELLAAKLEEVNGAPLTGVQNNLITQFIRAKNVWGKVVNSLVDKKADPKYRYRDFAKFLLDESGNFPEEVTTAMAYGMFTWLAEKNNGPVYKTDSQINAMLGRERDHAVSAEERNLADIGDRDRTAMRDLGARAVKALGLRADRNAPEDFQASLEASVGAYMLAAMLDRGYVERFNATIPRSTGFETVDTEMVSETDSLSSQRDNKYEKENFVRIIRNPETLTAVPAVEGIGAASRNSGSILTKLFDPTDRTKTITWESESADNVFNQKMAANGQQVPLFQQRAEKGIANKIWRVKQEAVEKWNQLSRTAQIQIAGGFDGNEQSIQASRRKGMLAKNEGLAREIDAFNELMADPRSQTEGFKIPTEVWSNQRVGYTGLINPQTSKIHRALIGMDDWTFEVPINQNAEQTLAFRVAQAQNLGIKTDELSLDDILRKRDEMLAEDDVRTVVDAIRENNITEEIQQLAIEIAGSNEGMATWDALVAQAAYEQAAIEGRETATISMMVEVDGKTNGPMLTLVLFGGGMNTADLQARISAGGFLSSSEIAQFAEYKQNGGLDLYQQIAQKVAENLMEQGVPEERIPVLQAVQYFMGAIYNEDTGEVTKAGRNMVKTPLTATMFGSNVNNAVDGAGYDLFDKILDRMEQIAKDGDYAEMQILANHLDVLTGGSIVVPADFSGTIEEIMNIRFSRKNINAIVNSYNAVYGDVLVDALKSEFEDFLAVRNSFNASPQAAFALYDIAYKAAKEIRIQELMESGDIAYSVGKDGRKIPLHGLTQQQIREIEKTLEPVKPVTNTYMSNLSKNKRQSGLANLKVAYNTDPATSRANMQEVRFGKQIRQNADNKSQASLSVPALVSSLASPGVASLIGSVHSTDSFISVVSTSMENVLNVHDASGAGALSAVQVAQNLNRATLRAMTNYHAPIELHMSLVNTLKGFQQLIQDGATAEQIKPLYAALMKGDTFSNREMKEYKKTGMHPLQQRLQESGYNAIHSTLLKLDTLADLTTVDQYPYPGGQHEVTAADRAEIQKQRTAVSTLDLFTEGSEAITAILQAMNQPTPAVTEEIVTAQDIFASNEQISDFLAQKILNARATKTKLAAKQLKELRHIQQQFIALGDIDAAIARVYRNDPNKAKLVAAKLKEQAISITETRQINDAGSMFGAAAIHTVEMLKKSSGLLAPGVDSQNLEAIQDRVVEGQSLREAVESTLEKGQSDILMATLNRLARAPREGRNGYLAGGYSPIPIDQSLANLFQGTQEVTAGQLIQALRVSGLAPELIPLLKLVNAKVDRNMPVILMTEDTVMESTTSDVVGNSRGMYEMSAASNTHTIYLRGFEYEQHGLTPEVALHELVHSVTANVIAGVQSGKIKDPTLVQAVADLNDLMVALIAEQDVSYEILGATSNIYELVTWGMTNEVVQKKLSEMPATRTLKNISNALMQFVDAVVRMVTGRSNSGQNTAMAQLINATTDIIKASADYQIDGNLVLQAVEDSSIKSADLMTSQEVFDSLGSIQGTKRLSPERTNKLRNTLNTIVERVHGPNGINAVERIYNNDDVMLLNVAQGEGTLEYALEGTNIELNAQEAYVADQVQKSLQVALSNNFALGQSMQKLFDAARKSISPAVFDVVTGNRADSEAIYKSVFSVGMTMGNAEKLSRFAALTIAYAPLSQALSTPMAAPANQPKTLVARVEALFAAAMDWISSVYAKTPANSPIRNKVEALSVNLAIAESKQRANIARQANNLSTMIDKAGAAVSTTVRDNVSKVLESNLLTQNSSPIIRATAAVGRSAARGDITKLVDELDSIASMQSQSRQNAFMQLLSEFAGSDDSTDLMYGMLRLTKSIEQQREEVKRTDEKIINDSFVDSGAYLTKESRAAVTKTIVRTDVQSLMGTYTPSDIRDMLSDKKVLAKTIQTEIQNLRAIQGIQQSDIDAYVIGSKALGWYLATGKFALPITHLNAYNVVHKVGAQQRVDYEVASASQAIVDRLSSLYALQYTPADAVQAAVEVMNTELNAGTDNGITALLRMHRSLQEKSHETLFQGDTLFMRKGYVSDLLTSRKTVVVATESQVKELKNRGYKVIEELARDSTESSVEPKYLMSIDDGGMLPRVTGVLSTTARRRMGTDAEMDAQALTTKLQDQAAQVAQDHLKFVPSNAAYYTLPVITDQGAITGFRHVMTENSKDSIMERDNDFAKVLGYTHSRLFDKVSSMEQNRNAVQALKAHYDAEFKTAPHRFIKVSAASSDAQIRENWKLMPKETRAAAREIFGGDHVWVRRDLENLFFGYRKNSIYSAWQTSPEMRSAREQIFIEMVEAMWPTLGLRLKQSEDVWQEAVAHIKDIRVVKNLSTLLMNISSNLTVVWAYGASWEEVKNHHIEGVVAAIAWQKDSRALADIERRVDLGLLQVTDEVSDEMVRLRDALENNPVKPLVDAGMFQTIVEDIDAVDDSSSYKNRVGKKIREASENLPKPVVDTAKVLYMAHDTSIYKLLNRSTQLSDFVSRYALYKYQTTKAEPISHEESLRDISDAFVNYDIPSGKGLQYLNDMGFVMFTKYYIRIQKVLMKLMGEKPSRMVTLMVLQNYFSQIGVITDSYVWQKFSNLTNSGMLEYPGAIDEGLVLNTALSLTGMK